MLRVGNSNDSSRWPIPDQIHCLNILWSGKHSSLPWGRKNRIRGGKWNIENGRFYSLSQRWDSEVGRIFSRKKSPQLVPEKGEKSCKLYAGKKEQGGSCYPEQIIGKNNTKRTNGYGRSKRRR